MCFALQRHNAGFYVKKVLPQNMMHMDPPLSVDKSGGTSLSMRRFGFKEGYLGQRHPRTSQNHVGLSTKKKRYHSNVLSTCYRFFPSFSQVLASHLHEVIHIVSLCDVNFQSQAFQTNGLDFVASVIHQGGNWHSTWLDGPARPHRAAFQLFEIVFGTSKGGPGFVGDINAIDRSGGFGEEKRRTGLAASQSQPFDESTISKSVLIRVILSRSGFKGFDSSGCSNPVQWGVRKITRLNSHVAKQHV